MTMAETKRKRKKEMTIASRQKGVLVLEDIHDPHNAAAVWRSCDAFGIQKVYLVFDREKVFDPRKVGKVASASANKWLDFEIFMGIEKCYEKFAREGYTSYATVLNEGAESLMATKFEEEKVAIVLGNEHRGLSEKAIELAERRIYIPMKGMVQSLNLSVTAAICLFELSRQRLGKEVALGEREKEKLREGWRWK